MAVESPIDPHMHRVLGLIAMVGEHMQREYSGNNRLIHCWWNGVDYKREYDWLRKNDLVKTGRLTKRGMAKL